MKRLVAEAEKIEDMTDCADVLTASSLMGALVHPPELFRALLKDEIMKASPIYMEIMDRGRKEGLREGKRDGLREGETRGKLEGKREAILAILGARFERVSRTIQRQVAKVSDEAALASILDVAATCGTLAEFRKQLPEKGAKT